MTKSNVHLVADEKLGGIQREFIEVERKAEVGDYVHITFPYHERYGKTVYVTRVFDDGGAYVDGDIEYHTPKYYVELPDYRVLVPTDIVHINGTRYHLVERKAEVGEKVLVIADWYSQKVGSILEIIDGKDFGFSDEKDSVNTYYAATSNKNGYIAFIEENNYRVLVPVADEKSSRVYTCGKCGTKLGDIACSNSKGGMYCSAKCADEEPLVTVDATQCSEAVLDMLANLARRVTSLESQLRDTQGNVERQAQEIETLHHCVEEDVEMIIGNIALLDERTQPLVEPKQAAEALLRKIAKLIEEEGVSI